MTHADECYPHECCGVIVGKEYIRCRNVSAQSDQFEIHPEDLAMAEDQGEILAYVHSHPDGTTRASELDLIQIELHKTMGDLLISRSGFSSLRTLRLSRPFSGA